MRETISQPNKKAARHQKIISYVAQNGVASAADLAEVTGMSLMTVHRDIDELTSRGFVRRFHGGVSAHATSAFESSAEFRRLQNSAAKHALAKKACELVEPGMSVMLDDSTTVLALAEALVDVQPLTVISNFRRVGRLFYELDETQMILIGGRYSRVHDSFISPASLTGLSNYAVDFTFHSSSAVDGACAYHQEQDVIEMKRAMLQCGARKVLMADSSKVGKTSLYRFAEISEFTDVIITDDVSKEFVAEISELTRVHIAKM